MAVVLLGLVVFGAIGFVFGRPWALLVPIAVVPLYALGIELGWWGNGFGDGWQYGFALFLAAGVLAAGVGLVVRGLLAHTWHRDEPTTGS